ncbi:hypothetical protein [Methanogenium cariaci]|uniref:hypothetical protein n=1 Tax=Methanogenium cariaci TaxID=2197 RepID=UPI000784AAFB|nr:hypothetical protein [Methanogenium cariaci]
MQSQITWGGILFLAAGLVLTLISVTVIPLFFLFYGIPLLVIGVALIIFRRREEIIEEAADRGYKE